ncbi:4-hydroxy-tetrahydrodipicolinate synthase [Alkalihalobacterium chitinilyticum]|uniref:4-hydroxy-tetrahydrodipicolinate synthase n=1 Tax=Alkalihalobacterium chitinilyticum TaxID=2980103 RepID=A0ABT5VBU6_9BACI|nr:4-hydroxy-tetrahydrodipicolinate synthase [Alkalihalobacterium chitinilyticum]MDE5412910.1 4-hydroxy-tetrahydrodipicolinate synthase [Alkalihalobacterium chitinilyticum]
MNKVNFGRVLTAMVTPFDELGAIDLPKTESLVEYLINNGSDGLVVAGTTGESPTITKDEKLALFETVAKTVNGRIPVIAGTGSNNTQASIELTKEAQLLGINGVMAVAPYYNKPSQQGMIEHFKAIANSTTLPVMLYNIPGRSVVNMTADTIIELSKVKNIVSVKEASGDLEQMAAIIEKTDADFSLYSGDDSLTLPSMAIGGNGVVSVASHIIGNEMQEIVQLFQAGSVNEAAKLHRKYLPIMKALFFTPNPTSVKMALQLKGIDVGSVRLPLVPLTNDEKNTLYQIISS